ncbi:Lead, cadmium, zinc and mercury transporting ATPase; Copper-translocating P-type ATPase [Alloactinosynnema sp. L-07]|nr:Lead, cadmium, zinc and mercury transporting ATPase; Copper-translocating P-type ATPase [Alloactinosynnema sp. L-07]
MDGHAVLVGRASLLAQWSIHLPEDLELAKKQAKSQGRTTVAVAWDGSARAVLVVADTIRPTSAEAIQGLRDLGLRQVLLTGDNDTAARGGDGRRRGQRRRSTRPGRPGPGHGHRHQRGHRGIRSHPGPRWTRSDSPGAPGVITIV